MSETSTNKTSGGKKVTVPKIYAAIAAIQAGVGNIPKDGVGPASQGSYKYVRNDDILEKISKLLVEHNVIVRPEIISHELITREIGANRTVALTVVTLKTTYISVEDGSEFSVVTTAEGADNGDKGGRKAVTQAQKIANLLTFSIATGEPDPDGQDVAPSGAAVAPRESAATRKISNAKGSDASAVYNQIKVFLGKHGLSGDVANTIGSRVSGGKPASEWTADTAVLTKVLEALNNGEVG